MQGGGVGNEARTAKMAFLSEYRNKEENSDSLHV